MLFTLAWAALAATFSFSIAMVVWGRNGDGTRILNSWLLAGSEAPLLASLAVLAAICLFS